MLSLAVRPTIELDVPTGPVLPTVPSAQVTAPAFATMPLSQNALATT
jgi:hypothetical protein